MSIKALVYAYVLGGFTFLPLAICAAIAWTIYTSVPVGDSDPAKLERKKLAEEGVEETQEDAPVAIPTNDQVKPRKAWLTVRRTFEERETDVSYVNMMRTFLDSRSKDPKRSRPKDMWYVVLKGTVLYLYEDEAMTDCEAAIQVSSHEVVVYPEGLQDGELFTKRNAICLKALATNHTDMNSLTKEMDLEDIDVDRELEDFDGNRKKKRQEREKLVEAEKLKAESRVEAFDFTRPWFIFVRTCVEMEDWYMALVHAANYSDMTILEPVRPVFRPSDMQHLVTTLDDQPDVIPMRWLNAFIGRIFFSFYRTQNLENFIINRLMKKISKVKAPTFLQNITVTDVSVGNSPPTLSKPMLKELTQEGDMSLEVRLMYKGEIRLTVEATAIINLGQRFKTYSVKLVLAVVLRKLDGNLLIKVKRPPTNRLWYAFTQPPEMELDVEPVVSDRQIKWSMILSTIESRIKEVINESVVMPNMDDIAFFDTDEHKHRGGIWADAGKKERTVSDILDEKPQQTPATSSTGETDTLQKSKSTDAVTEAANSIPEPDVVNRAATVDASQLSQSPSNRQSWFSSTRSTNSLGIPESEADAGQEQHSATGHIERGRSNESSSTDNSGRRAISVPAPASAAPVSSAGQSDLGEEGTTSTSNQTDLDSDDTLNSGSPRVRSISSGATLGGPDASPFAAASTSRNILSNPATRTSTVSSGSSNTSTSSFLSALRSKADKQTLNNAAKEAMRKWSTNWKGFKAEHGGGPNQNQNGAAGNEETADTGGVHPDSNSSGSSAFSFPSKRTNYADLRAAVAGRMERERTQSNDRMSVSSTATAPIDIPARNGTTAAEDRPGSSSTPPNNVNDQVQPSSSQTSSSPKGPSLLRNDSARASPSPPKLTTQTSSTGSMHMVDSPATPPAPAVLAPPIKTQPSQGASMKIPGIHVSHRNEVMSMGYAPPRPPTPPASSPSDAKLRTPTIQSMYRLFKSPTAGGSALQSQQQGQTQGQGGTSPSPSPPGSSRTSVEEGRDSETPLASTSEASSPVPGEMSESPTLVLKPPPPLPPRKSTISSVTSSSSPSPRRTISPSPGPSDSVTSSAPLTHGASPSASDVLKHIVEQDSSMRKTRDGAESQQQRRGSFNTGGSGTTKKRHSLGAKRITQTPPPAEHFPVEGTPISASSANNSLAVANETPEESGNLFVSARAANEQPTQADSYGDGETPMPVVEDRGGVDPPQLTEKRVPPPLPPRKLSSAVAPA